MKPENTDYASHWPPICDFCKEKDRAVLMPQADGRRACSYCAPWVQVEQELTRLRADNERLRSVLWGVREELNALHGAGLQVAHYHLNGDLEPLDNMIEDALNLADTELAPAIAAAAKADQARQEVK